MHDIGIDQLIDQLVTQPFDIDGAALSVMKQCLFALRRADQAAGTAGNCLTFKLHDGGIAFGAARRHDEYGCINRTHFEDYYGHFRNHVTGATHHHGVSNAQIFPANFVLVMQRGIRYRGAADEHRLQARHRRDRTGAAYLHVDAEQECRRFFSGKLVGNRKPRCA